MKKILAIGCFLALIYGCGSTNEEDLLRNITQGQLIGVEANNNTYAWKGIPFAQPPVEELRWKAPLAPFKFDSIFDASKFADICFQRDGVMTGNEGGWSGSEDCLYLNVWTPDWSAEDIKSKKAPVMMWIHGGGNTIGSADTYDPSHIVSKHNVIVVTVQYRMSNLGWFRHPSLRQENSSEEDKSGNFGTLDNIIALKWISENIQNFGGDRDNVTIYGESAGGHNVAAIYASPLANGLFHKAIVQSGILSHSSVIDAESYYPESGISGIQSSKEIINRLMLNDGTVDSLQEGRDKQNSMDLNDLESYLRDKSPEELLIAYSDARPKKGGMTRAFNDGYVIRKEGIYETFVNNKLPRVPIMLGTTRYETKLFNMRNPDFVKWGEGEGFIARTLSQFGIDQLPLEILRPDYYNAINQYASDSWKERAVDSPSRDLTNTGYKSTFAYRFDWDELPNVLGMDFAELIGSAHAMELLFLFPAGLENIIVKNLVIEDQESVTKLSDQMMSYWAEFAYSGSPGKGRSNDLPEWTAWSDQDKYMILDSELDQGLIMSDDEITTSSIVSNLEKDTRLTLVEKCESLFALTYGEDLPQETFDGFSDGYCLSLDYSELLKRIENRGDDDDQES